MDRHINIRYDRKTFDRINRRIWLHHQTWIHYLILGPFLIAPPIAIYFLGRWSPFQWLYVGAIAFVLLLSPIYSYLVTLHRARERYISSGTDELNYHLTDDYIGFEDQTSRIEIFWEALTGLLQFPEGTVLQFGKKISLLIPASDIDSELRTFIASRLAENQAVSPKQPQLHRVAKDY